MTARIDATQANLARAGAGESTGPRGELRIDDAELGLPRAAEQASGTTFGAVLEKTVAAASAKQVEASQMAEALAQGRQDDLHGTMITMKEAEISMKLVGSVRNKLLDAFHELWRINV